MSPSAKKPKLLRWAVLVLLLLPVAAWASMRPSNDRNWSPDQAKIPVAQIDGSTVHISNIRNAVYRSTVDYDVHYEDRTYDLRDLESVWYIVEPFPGLPGSAHTFLSFGFGEGNYLSVSVEIRKEQGESFSALKGLFRQYELAYVAADERDAIKLRTNYRNDDVILYPIRVSPEKARTLFLSMANRMNKLAARPEFYNALVNTCATNILDHVNEIADRPIPWSPKVLLPENSDKIAYGLGIIDTDLPLEAAREYFRINERAEKYADDPEFSKRIREFSN